MASASMLGSCVQGPEETESIQLAATITRVANTTLKMPSGGSATYSMTTAFPGLTFTAPIAMATPPGETNRLFVVERAGRIKVIPNLASPSPSTFLDISSRVATNGEEGLVGLAFHPNYASNGFFYVFYSTTINSQIYERLSRFKVSSTNSNAADSASELVMIDQLDAADNHNGGDLHFGPDGYLYVSLGDGGQGDDTLNNSQLINKDFFSAILRIDVDRKAGNLTPNAHAAAKAGTYLVPADNPFVGATSFNGVAVNPSQVRTEFWAVGLRNPFRFSFDSSSGQLWCGDVGQSAREEIDLIQKGKNYGWAFREGKIAGPKAASQPPSTVLTDPVWDYPPTEGKSVIGGVVYHGTNLSELAGAYVFGDYISGNVWSLTQSASGVYSATKLANEPGVNAFGIDPRNGDLLVSNISSNTIRRLVRAGGGSAMPALLSQTGAFSNLATLTPNPGIVPYAPNVSFWSDNALKSRWFSIPNAADKMTFAADGNWSFPAGQVWIKHFEMEMVRGDPSSRRRLETRFLVKTSGGIYGVGYKWNANQTDADLVPEAGLDESLTINVGGKPTTQTWHYASRSECLSCHTAVAGLALSFNTRQLNGSFTYSSGASNQIQALSDAGYFTAPVAGVAGLPKVYAADDLSQSLETRAQSYLQVNCAQCHQPGGTGQGGWDARMKTRLDLTGIINGMLSDNRGDAANRVLTPQDQGHSMLLRRLQAAPNAPRMPPLGSNVLDQAGIDLISRWVMAVPHIFEAEALPRSSSPAATQQADSNASAGNWTSFTPAGAGAPVDFGGITLPAGTFTFKVRYRTDANRAQISVKIDGTQMGGTIDQYAVSPAYVEATVTDVSFSSAGAHTIRLTTTGKNTSSTGFVVSADVFTFTPAGPPQPPPAAPTGLVVNGGVGQASLTWADNAVNETGFKIERKVLGTADATYVAVNTVSANAVAFTDTVAAGSYTYRVKAINGAGESSPSNSADATVTTPAVAISNLVVNDNLPAGCTSPNCNRDKWSIETNFQSGVSFFGDRTYTVDRVENAAILGGAWIRTSSASKSYTGSPLATFTASGSFVYLLIDDRWNAANGRPTWLTDNAYVDQGYNVMVRQNLFQTFPYSVWRKPITSGSTVILPTLGGTTAPTYVVIVK